MERTIRFLATNCCALLGSLFFTTIEPSQAQEKFAGRTISPPTLAEYLKSHKGPVLDVRMPGDCADNRSLRKTTNAIGFDFGHDSPDGRKMAREMFLSQVLASHRLLMAKERNETVLVVCCAGGRSEAAAVVLSKNGYRVAHLVDGLQSIDISTTVLKRAP